MWLALPTFGCLAQLARVPKNSFKFFEDPRFFYPVSRDEKSGRCIHTCPAPFGGVYSSVVERFVHIEEAEGSRPSTPT